MSSPDVADLPLLDAKAVGGLLGVPEGTVRDFARCGRLPSVRIGRRVMFCRSEIEATVRRAMRDGRGI